MEKPTFFKCSLVIQSKPGVLPELRVSIPFLTSKVLIGSSEKASESLEINHSFT